MKKLFLIGAFGITSVFALTAFTHINSNTANTSSSSECQYGRCSQIKADGYQCKNCAQAGSYYCWSHR